MGEFAIFLIRGFQTYETKRVVVSNTKGIYLFLFFLSLHWFEEEVEFLSVVMRCVGTHSAVEL